MKKRFIIIAVVATVVIAVVKYVIAKKTKTSDEVVGI